MKLIYRKLICTCAIINNYCNYKICILFKIDNLKCIGGEQLRTDVIHSFVRSPAEDTFRFSEVCALLLTFIGFSLSTGQCRQLIDVSGAAPTRATSARDRFTHLNTDKPVDIGDETRTRENDARGRSKNEGCFASHV